MAWVAALGAGLGAGSTAAGIVTLATAAVTVYAGAESAKASRRAGQATAAETQLAANAEGDAARQREIERKRNLLRAISSQTASSAAAGVKANEGSPNALINLDIAEANTDDNVDYGNTKAQQRAMTFRGQNAIAVGNAAGRTSMLDTAANTLKIFKK